MVPTPLRPVEHVWSRASRKISWATTSLSVPRITVVTPSFNQGRFIEETIRSVLLQGYPNLEYIVVDGGSTDDSVRVIQHYAPCLSHWVSETDRGQADAIAKGFERATGDVMCWLNSDDVLMPNALSTVGRAFAMKPAVGVVYGNLLVLDEQGNVTARRYPPFHLSLASWSLGQAIGQESTFWRRTAYERVGGLDRSKFFAMDYDLFVRMFKMTRFEKVRAFLGGFRIHGEAKTAKHEATMWKEFEASKRAHSVPELPDWGKRAIRKLDQTQSRIERVLGGVLRARDALRGDS